MRELWLYLRCVYHNEVTCTAYLVGMSFAALAGMAVEFSWLLATILLIPSAICVAVFIFSGAALNTFYSYAVTAAAIGSATTTTLTLSPDMKPAERTGAVLACYDLHCPYVAA